MRELALFAGAGGGILGGVLLGWRTVCAVEIDAYCRRVLLARQRDGHLPRFPIWDDIKTFDGRPWRGHVDVISGGFPCTPFSSAAHGCNVDAPLWPEMLRALREIRPRWVLIENTYNAGLYLRDVVAPDLQREGYLAAGPVDIPASAMGAPHHRERLWMVGHTDNTGKPGCPVNDLEVAGVRDVRACTWWDKPPDVAGIHDGVAHRVDRLRAIGNGQVPSVARLAWRTLTDA